LEGSFSHARTTHFWKSDGCDDLVLAVERLQNDWTFLTPRVAQLVLSSYLQKTHNRSEETILARLSTREREVVQLVSEGNTTKQVASILHMAVKTAETHRNHVMRSSESIRSPGWSCTRCETISYKFTSQFLRLQMPNPIIAGLIWLRRRIVNYLTEVYRFSFLRAAICSNDPEQGKSSQPRTVNRPHD
jgi:hypothetical protein